MPGTPSVRSNAVHDDNDVNMVAHSSCPPEDDRNDTWLQAQIRLNAEAAEAPVLTTSNSTPPSASTRQPSTSEAVPNSSPHIKMDVEIDPKALGMMSPVSISEGSTTESEKGEANTPTKAHPMPMSNYSGGSSQSSGTSYQLSNIRLLPNSPSFLRPGSKFVGLQESQNNKYQVEVTIKQIDMRESTMCGFLKIDGLTKDNPSLTTFFEGEIIGTHYSFLTKHPDWHATSKTDLEHWVKFPSFVSDHLKNFEAGITKIRDNGERRVIYMRWKERFLVPDHRVRTIDGASFEGFYYIAFDRTTGGVEGIYFHAKSERFQGLHLKRLDDRGCLPSIELR